MQELGAKIDETMIDRSLPRLKTGLDVLREHEFTAIELPVHGLDAIKNGRLDYAQVMHVRELLADYDFRYSVHSPDPVNLADQDELDLHVAVLKSSIEFALLVNATVLVYHPGRYLSEQLYMRYEKHNLSSDEKRKLLDKESLLLQRIADEYPEMMICMENSRPYLFHSPYCYAERLGHLAEQVEHINRNNIKINLDIGHLYLSSKYHGFDAIKAAENIRPYIGHIHIHDNFRKVVFHHEKQQTRPLPLERGDSHMPVGWGEIPFEEILSTFIDGYEGMFMMELQGRYFDSVLELRDNLRAILSSCILRRTEQKLTIANVT